MLNALVLTLALVRTDVRTDVRTEAPSFAGEWTTTYGDMTLTDASGTVRGTYLMGGAPCSIEGSREKGVLTFTYREAQASGEGRFRLAADGQSFTGEWRQRGSSAYNPWSGKRRSGGTARVAFDGVWETTFGRMRLARSGAGVQGSYAFADGTLDGHLDGDVLKFRYKDQAPGEGEFRIAADGASFAGRWHADGDERWRDWTGQRVEPVAGRRWLVVLEARWEASLAEREYSYGEMLKAFFQRTQNVQVRHRFYTDKTSLKKWMRETALLAEPVVLYLSGHGSPEGIHTDSGPAAADTLAEPLRAAGNIQLLHFGACEVMKGQVPAELQRQLAPSVRFPISGFAQNVDWAASAVTDFMYLDLILSRDLPPEKAAAELRRLMPFTAQASVKTAYDGVSFRLLEAPSR